MKRKFNRLLRFLGFRIDWKVSFYTYNVTKSGRLFTQTPAMFMMKVKARSAQEAFDKCFDFIKYPQTYGIVAGLDGTIWRVDLKGKVHQEKVM